MKATDPAFGCVAFGEKESLYNEGINIRTYLAGKAMQGLLSKWTTAIPGDGICERNPNTKKEFTYTDVATRAMKAAAQMSVIAADALIEELNKEKK